MQAPINLDVAQGRLQVGPKVSQSWPKGGSEPASQSWLNIGPQRTQSQPKDVSTMPNQNPHVHRQRPAQTPTCIDRAQPNPSLVSTGLMKPNSPLVSTRPSPNPHLYRQVPAHHFTCIDGAQPNPSRVSTRPIWSITSLLSTRPSPTPPLSCINKARAAQFLMW